MNIVKLETVMHIASSFLRILYPWARQLDATRSSIAGKLRDSRTTIASKCHNDVTDLVAPRDALSPKSTSSGPNQQDINSFYAEPKIYTENQFNTHQNAR